MLPTKQIFTLPIDFISSFFEIFFDKRLFKYCFFPWLIGTFLFLVFISLGFFNFTAINDLLFTKNNSWSSYIYYIGTFLLIFGLSATLSILFIFIFAGFIIEKTIHYLLNKNSFELKEEEKVSFLKSVVTAIKDNLRRILFILISLILLFLFSFFPPLIFLWYILSSFLAGYELLDLPLQLSKFSFRERIDFYFSNKLITTVAGSLYLAALLIPIVNIFALQASYVFGVKVIKKLT